MNYYYLCQKYINMDKLLSEIKKYHDQILIIHGAEYSKNDLDTLFEIIFNVLEEKYTFLKTYDFENLTSNEIMFEISTISNKDIPYIIKSKSILFNIKLIVYASIAILVDKNETYIIKNRYGKNNYPINIKSFSRKIKFNKIIK